MQRSFYFLHIPKTAGTTLNFAEFPQIFAPEEICPAYSYRQLLEIPAALRSAFCLYMGHFFYFLNRLLPAKPLHTTFLHDLVDRVLSLYNYVRREPTHFQHAAVRSLKGGIRDFVRSREFLAPDFQVTALPCDVDPLEALSRAQGATSGDIDPDAVIIQEMIRHPPREQLAIACQRLEEMEFVGITEFFDESVRLLCRIFGWSPPAAYGSLNVAPHTRLCREQLPPDVLEEILACHRLDTELHGFAKDLFLRRLGAAQRNGSSNRKG